MLRKILLGLLVVAGASCGGNRESGPAAPRSGGSLTATVGTKTTATPNIVKLNLDVGKSPEGIAVNTVTHRVFVAGEPEDTGGGVDTDLVAIEPADPKAIYDIDPISQQLMAVVPVNSEGEYVAVNPVTNRVYHQNKATSEVAVIDGATDTVLNYVSLSFADGAWQPEGIAIDTAQNLIYVGAKAPPLSEVPAGLPIPTWCKAIPEPAAEASYECWNPGRIFVIDGATSQLALAPDGTPLSFIAGDDPESIVFSAATGKVYAANEDDGTITVAYGSKRTDAGITAPVIRGTISRGVLVPGWMAPECNSERICSPLNGLWPAPSACDAFTDKAKEADKMATDPKGNVYITDDQYRVAKIDGATDAVVGVLGIGGYECVTKVVANNVVVSTNGQPRLYVASEQNTIAVVDPATMTLTSTLTVSGAIHLDAITADPSVNRVYVTDEDLNALFMIQGSCAKGQTGACP